MKLIAHRKNSVVELLATPRQYGVEIDVRSEGGELVLAHDPFTPGPSLDEWLDHYEHGTLILNVKEEGLEQRTLDLLGKHEINDFFFLDQSFPFLFKWAQKGLRQAAVRFSEMESAETAARMADLVDWVWVDCLTTAAPDTDAISRLAGLGMRTCIVSPELHGRPIVSIAVLRRHLAKAGIEPSAVCTKRPKLWEVELA